MSRFKQRLFGLVLCLTPFGFCHSAGAVSLITNGGFETGNFTGWTQGGNTGFTFVAGTAHSGSFAANLGPIGTDGTLSQTVATTAGAQYNVTFWLQNDVGPDNGFSASFAGINLSGGGFPALPLTDSGPFNYTEYTFLVTAAGTSSVLQFNFHNDLLFFHLDDISVDPVSTNTPLPGALPLFVTGLGALGLLGWKRKRKAAA